MTLDDVRISLPDRYKVVRHVANGGMASVWAAEDAILGRLVAVKVLAAHVAADPSSRVRFEREARTAAKVSSHPNVVTIYDVGEHGGAPFIVMELYAGGSVADRLRGPGTVRRDQAVAWLEHAAAGLDFAHDEGVVHRDVKPANLMLDERGRLAVGDFGIARLVDDSSLTQAGQVLGTAAYISPEQALGRAATAASDRYALGIVAFELLSGQRPFGGDHIAAQARQHVESDPPPSGLGHDADDVLHRAMAKDPDDRYPTATRFVEELQAVTARASAPAAVPTRATRRMTPQAAGAAAAGTPTPTPTPAPAPAPPARSAPVFAPDDRGPRSPTQRGGGGGRRGWIALAAVGAVALAVALAALVGGGEDPQTASDGATTTSERAERPAQTGEQPAQTTPPAPSEQPSAAEGDAEGEGEGGAGPSADGESPSALNDAGYSRLQSGDAEGAVPLLERAVAGFAEQGDDADATTYGYALYNLAEALSGSGRPAEAIPFYERRLEVSPGDRPGVVRASLAEARRAAGQSPSGDASGGGKGSSKVKDKDAAR